MQSQPTHDSTTHGARSVPLNGAPKSGLSIVTHPAPSTDIAVPDVPAELTPAMRRFAEELRAAVESALQAKDDALRAREEELRRVAVALATSEATAQGQLATFAEVRARLESANRQLGQSIDERDRKLVTFSRKLDQLRAEAEDGQSRDAAVRNRRAALLTELESLSMWSRARRRDILRELAAL